jgi:hypothetical protein
MQRAVVSGGTGKIPDALRTWHAQPGRRVFYCGSGAHAGESLLEAAGRSARTVVKTLA